MLSTLSVVRADDWGTIGAFPASCANGQYISGFSTGAYVCSTPPGGTPFRLGAPTRTLILGRSLALIFNASLSLWVELFYGNN